MIDENAETTYAAVDKMGAEGGSFVKALAQCWWHADPFNKSILVRAFESYFIQYGAVHDPRFPSPKNGRNC